MVKITNPLGDFKVGKQGEAVYQGRYGEQIRRTAAKKRAMPSKRQIEHRALYRAALDWRKALSLPNRRYLDGYCIANWIVDDYKIPLPWSRFALKIYLQAVKFVSDLEIIETAPISGEKKDYTEEQAWAGVWFGQELWWAQTFTPLETYTLGKVGFLLSRKAALIQDVVEGIRLTENGFPIGSDLITASRNGSTIPITIEKEWWYIDFEPTLELQEGVMYAVVGRVPDATGSNIQLYRTLNDTRYPRGQRLDSGNSGVNWTKWSYDWNFEVWSATIEGEYSKEGILHVRHPALASVIQKRNGKTLKQWSNLSDLDKEYLTGQVGLDVEQGDYTEATTLPGIKYRHTVL